MKLKIFKIRLAEEHIEMDEKSMNDFMKNHEIFEMSSQMLSDQEKFWSILIRYEEKKTVVQEVAQESYIPADPEYLSSDEIKMLDSLKLWRSDKAKEQNIPHYMIASNKELFAVVKFKPAKKEELIEIKGFGKYKIENFGSEIIEILEQL